MKKARNENKNETSIEGEIYNTIIHTQSKSVDKETFDYGLNVMSELIYPIYEKMVALKSHHIKGSNDLHKLCNSIKIAIQDIGFVPFEYKGFNYGVQLKEFYIENIDKNMNIKFYVGVDVGISKEDYYKKNN